MFPVKNAQAINDGELDPEQLGVQAVDDRTLVVTLEKPASYFLRLASTWTLFPLRQDIVERYGDQLDRAGHVVINGPFVLKEWHARHTDRAGAQRVVLGPKPRIQRATYRLFPEDGAEQMLAAYEAGEIDTTGAGVRVELPPSQIDRMLADPVLSAQEIPTSSSPATEMIIVNHRDRTSRTRACAGARHGA